MLRYVAFGSRNFTKSPVPSSTRLNWEFYAISRGCAGPLFSKGNSPPLRSKTLWLIPAHTTYGWRGNEKNCYRLVVHFGTVPEPVRKAINGKQFLAVSLAEEEIREISSLVKNLDEHFHAPHQLSHLYYELALLKLSLIILKDQPIQKSIPLDQAAHERVENALAWYSLHMARNPTVDEVAEALHMTATHLRRMTKKARGVSPHQLFRKLQMKRATELLVDTSDTLDEVGRACGFKSVADFARVFHREMGSTANHWRTSRRAKNADL